MALKALLRSRSASLGGNVLQLLSRAVAPASARAAHFGNSHSRRGSRFSLGSSAGTAERSATVADPVGEEAFSTLVEPQMTWPGRSHQCGVLREGDAGTSVSVCGWVDGYRNMGGVLFVDVRDHSGILQASVVAQYNQCLLLP